MKNAANENGKNRITLENRYKVNLLVEKIELLGKTWANPVFELYHTGRKTPSETQKHLIPGRWKQTTQDDGAPILCSQLDDTFTERQARLIEDFYTRKDPQVEKVEVSPAQIRKDGIGNRAIPYGGLMKNFQLEAPIFDTLDIEVNAKTDLRASPSFEEDDYQRTGFTVGDGPGIHVIKERWRNK